MRRFLRGLAIVAAVLMVGYLLGPKPAAPALDAPLPAVAALPQLEAAVQTAEAAVPGLKPDNQARIVWADPARQQKTPYSILYVHGFTASQEEGDPVHTDVARHFGCNLYLARLADHGTQSDSVFKSLTADKYYAAVARAYAIAQQLGDSVIVMGTSAGGAMSLYLTAHQPRVRALVLFSPCVAILDPSAKMLDKPWGLQMARLVSGGDFGGGGKPAPDSIRAYWTGRYRLEGVVALQNFLDHAMLPETFARIKQPVLLTYYYKNEEAQDKVVSVPAMLRMFDELGTPAALKRKIAFPEAGDHVITSHLRTKDWPNVEHETIRFLAEVVGLKPVVASVAAPPAALPVAAR